MKKSAITFMLSLLLISCGRESSPEGRFQIKFEEMQRKVDILENQNNAILDSIGRMNQELKALRKKEGSSFRE